MRSTISRRSSTRVVRASDPPVTVEERGEIRPDELPGLTAGYDFILDDHTQLPTAAMRACKSLQHVIFLGTGARSYMDPEALADSASPSTSSRAMAIPRWPSTHRADVGGGAGACADGRRRAGGELVRAPRAMQLTGKTLGLIGFGGIAAEVARIAAGSGMRVLAWNRTPKTAPGVDVRGPGYAAGGEPGGLGAPAAER